MDKLTRGRAALIGILVIAAYSMLSYDLTGSKSIGFITDEISGLAVIGIAVLLYPIFKTTGMKMTNRIYMASRIIEGLLMLIGGFVIILGLDIDIRNFIYTDIHIWFFISGALALYVLFYVSNIIPRFISVWGVIASLLLLLSTVLGMMGIESPWMAILLLPIILNEFALAGWLIFKGFKVDGVTGESQSII